MWRKHNKKHERNQILTIRNIKYLGYKEEMRCLHVQDRLHLYQSSDFVPTCNSGKDSIAKMIASEWNRRLYYVTGGNTGRFVPTALSSDNDDVVSPLFLVSDIDKYPFLIINSLIS